MDCNGVHELQWVNLLMHKTHFEIEDGYGKRPERNQDP